MVIEGFHRDLNTIYLKEKTEINCVYKSL